MENSVNATTKKVSKYIYDDLTFSILSKLPIKSLKRFGCVRKSWVLLLQDSHFMSIYRKNITSKNHFDSDDGSYILRHVSEVELGKLRSYFYFLFGERLESKIKLNYSLPFEDVGQDFYIVGSGSINGILGIVGTCNGVGDFALWNPTIEEFKVIPPSPVESIPYRMSSWLFHELGYDYCRDDYKVIPPCWSSWLIHGFYYDHCRDDYKVIRRTSFGELTDDDYERLGLKEEDVPWKDISYEPVWEIYSLRSNSWRKVDVNFTTMLIPCVDGDIVRFYLNGMCHWWYKSMTYSSYFYETCLVSFDVSDEVIFTTPMPLDNGNCIDFEWVQRHMVMLINGFIALTSYREETTTFHISILGEIGVKESWTKLFIVGPLTCVAHPIGAGKKGDIFLEKNDGELVYFNLDTQIMNELGIEAYRSQVVIYNESLLSMGGINN